MRRQVEQLVAGAGRKGHRALVAGMVTPEDRLVCGWAPAGARPDERTIFEIGSVTKPMTGTLLRTCTWPARVDLSNPLSRHLPHQDAPRWRLGEPTLEQLATHRAALPNAPRGMVFQELAFVCGLRREEPWAALDERGYRAAVARTVPRRAPGGRMRYSSLGFGLLGDALARRAGASYEDLLARRLLSPLGMADSGVTVATHARARLLPGHSRRGKPRPPIEDRMPAAGSVRSTASDLLRWLEASLEPGPTSPGPALALAQQPRIRAARGMAIGLGWLIVRRRGRAPIAWHNGGTWGFRSFAGFVPEQGIAVVVLSNTARSVDRLAFRLIDEARPPRNGRP